MKFSSNKGRKHFRYLPAGRQAHVPSAKWRSLERFHTIGLRLAGFLHQFKTPLHVIQSQAELLLDDAALSPTIRQSLQIIQQNAGRLAAQTQTMMEAARGTQSGFEIIPVERLMEDICHAVQTDCRKRNISIEKDILVSSPIRMESVALEGALHNLVNNAIEAMPQGGTLRIAVYSAKGRTGVVISDTGSGMTSKRLAQIQKPFQTNKANGTGLGLYITRHILRRHKAAITWVSKPGHGTKVTVTFPTIKTKTPSPILRTGEGGDEGTALPSPYTLSRLPAGEGKHAGERLWRRLFGAFAMLAFLVAPLLAANYPQLLRLQGRFTDTKIPLNDTLPVRFSIWDTEDGYGNLLWEEVQNVTVQNNAFQVILGRSKPLTPSVFSGGDRWVEMQLGNDAPMRPRHWIPNQYIQAQVAAAQSAPTPVVVPPPAPVTPPPSVAPPLSDQERRELELQIEKYNEPATQPQPVPEPKRPPKHKHIVQTAPTDDSGSQGPVYEVQAGDTLKSIAQKLYGNAELWYDLYYLNRDRLGPMGYLFTGQILVLPTQTPGVSPK